MEFVRRDFLPHSLFFVLSAGFLLRVSFILFNQHPPVSDEHEYDRLALSIVTEGSYADNGVATAYRPVGYPAFLAVLYWSFGHSYLVAKLCQSVLDILTAFLLFLIGRGLGTKAGIYAAASWSFFVPAILFAGLLLAETFAVFLLMLAVYVFLTRNDEVRMASLSSFGVLIGLTILVKPAIVLFPVVLFLVSRKIGISLRHALIPIAAMLIALSPWVIRNIIVLDTFNVATNGGMNLYIGNNPQATGAYRGAFPPELADSSLSETTRNSAAIALAIDYVKAHPGRFLLNGAKKIAHVFRSEGDVLIASFPDRAPAGTGFKERYRSVPVIFTVITNSAFFVLLLVGIAGFVYSDRNQLFWTTSAFLVASLATDFVVFGGSRFHFIFMPFAALYFHHGTLVCRKEGTSVTRRRMLMLLGVFLVLFALWSYELIAVYSST